jgi:hypothetical protein
MGSNAAGARRRGRNEVHGSKQRVAYNYQDQRVGRPHQVARAETAEIMPLG